MAEGGSSGPENTPSPVTALKKELIDPRTISKKTDPEGRDRLAQGVSTVRGLKQQVGGEITQQEKTLEAETTGPKGLVDRVRGILRGPEWTRSAQIKEELAKLKQRHENIPDPQAIIDAYYEKVASEPLSVQEK
ncbi:MAG: hypothetical protein PHR64_03480, partial [Candidatus Shapirobacteria bacterium]|nr:hypothetical protein [Candidatus Shapirobacteria bacterium]